MPFPETSFQDVRDLPDGGWCILPGRFLALDLNSSDTIIRAQRTKDNHFVSSHPLVRNPLYRDVMR